MRSWRVKTSPRKPAVQFLAGFLALGSAALAAPETVAEFSPKEAKSLGWRIVNDGVMGGLSKGQLDVSEDGILTFKGNLSLRNNGGFSSLRTERLSMDLSDAEGVKLRVKGDGRTYQMRFNTNARFRGMEVSFKADFDTRKGEWTEVEIPFSDFVGSFRGMTLRNEKFDPAKISRVGMLLADKKEGSFNLQVDWVRPYGGDTKLASTGGKDVVSVALGDGRFKTLAAALGAADLVDTLQGEGPFTVFAPTDEAFAKLPKGTVESLLKPENKDKLVSILTYHVVPGSVNLSAALSAREANTVQGAPVKISFTDGRVKVNEASLVNADISCSNGVIHVIDSVILPPEPSKTILNVAKQAGSFNTLLAAVEAAGLTDALSGDKPVTVLAPTDEAFAKLPKGTLETLLKPENKKQLAGILAMHVIPGNVSAGDALNAGKAKPFSWEEVEFSINKGLFQVNGATILKTDIECENGTIHVIDSVILPKSGKKEQSADPKTALKQIEDAIGEGVPVFNRGHHGQCADIYRDCMMAIADGGIVEQEVAEVMREWVEKSSKIKSDTDRAWMLRRGLDHIYAGLSGN